MDGGTPIDASGVLVDGTTFDGPVSFRTALLTSQKDAFPTTLTDKLVTYAVGRGVEYYDMPAVRSILREAEAGAITGQHCSWRSSRAPRFQ